MERSSDSGNFGINIPITFKFPIRSMQLCEQPIEPNIFWVQDRINVGQLKENKIAETLDNVYDNFGSYNKCLKILTNEVFDPIYSVLYYLEDVSLTIRKDLIQHLVHGLKNLLNMIEKTKILKWAAENYISEKSLG